MRLYWATYGERRAAERPRAHDACSIQKARLMLAVRSSGELTTRSPFIDLDQWLAGTQQLDRPFPTRQKEHFELWVADIAARKPHELGWSPAPFLELNEILVFGHHNCAG